MHIIEPKRYEIAEVFGMIGEDNLLRRDARLKKTKDIEVDGFNVHPISLRYMTFYQKGTACVCCGKVGTHFKLCGEESTTRRHFNLFADDGTLITKDHILPKSKGGEDVVENLQPMCEKCNIAKGNYHPDVKFRYITATRADTDKTMYFRDINKAAFHAVVNFIKPSKKNKEEVIRASINAVLGVQRALEDGLPYCGFIWGYEEK